jgi:hypothetical protein
MPTHQAAALKIRGQKCTQWDGRIFGGEPGQGDTEVARHLKIRRTLPARIGKRGGDFERCKQRCRAMPLVIVALAGQGAAIGQLQITLRSLQSLDRGLLVHAQHNGLRGRGDIEADNIRGYKLTVEVQHLLKPRSVYRDPALVQRVLAKLAEV